jgi:hypothetical protein
MAAKLSITDPSANISDTAPKATAADVTHTAIKAAIGSVPGIGSAAAEVFSSIITPPLSKRKDEWIESIVEGLKNLKDQVDDFSIENLKDDEVFITTVSYATQIAIRNHQAEKLNALKNAILNTALRNAPDDDLQLIFLNYIDTSTEWHLRILAFLDSPQGWFEENGRQPPNIHMGAKSSVLENAFEELRGKRTFYDLIVEDLNVKQLIGTNSLHTMMSGGGIMQSVTTGIGAQFLAFISDPDL